MLKKFEIDKNPFSTGTFALDNINDEISLYKKLSLLLKEETLLELFAAINKNEQHLVEYIYYDYRHKIYEALMETSLKQCANTLSDKIVDEFKNRDMYFLYYSLLISENKININFEKEMINKTDKGAVVNVLHYDIYQIVPLIMSKNLDRELIFYADGGALDRIMNLIIHLNPKIKSKITILPLEYSSVIKAMRKVKKGGILFIMPEINPNKAKNNFKRIRFLGTEIFVPVGSVRISYKCAVPSYLAYFDRDENRLYLNSVEVTENEGSTVKKLWNEIEEIIKNKPEKWSIWEKWNDIRRY